MSRKTPVSPDDEGKIDSYHRTMKYVVKLQSYCLPGQLKRELETSVQHYSHERLIESLKSLTRLGPGHSNLPGSAQDADPETETARQPGSRSGRRSQSCP